MITESIILVSVIVYVKIIYLLYIKIYCKLIIYYKSIFTVSY